jgi:hypothetical protein
MIATITIQAPADVVFDVLADPSSHAAIDGTGWVRESLDGKPLAETGQVFRMAMYHENHPDKNYEIANRVEVFDPPNSVAWQPGRGRDDADLDFGGWIWRYDLTSVGTAETEVTLTYDWSGVPSYTREHIGFPPFDVSHLDNSLKHLAALAGGSRTQHIPMLAVLMWLMWFTPAVCAPLRCGLELIRRRRRDRRSAADPPQLVVDPAVRLACAVVGDRHERVELAAKLPQLPMRRRPRHPTRRGALCQLFFLPAPQQVSHLFRVEQAGDTEVVGLLLAPRRRRRAERGSVEDHLVQFGIGAQRFEAVVQFTGFGLASLDVLLVFLRLPVWLAQHMVALRFHLAGQQQQVRHRRQEDARRLTGPAGPDEPADRLGEEQRRRRAGRVHPDGTSTPSDTIRTATSHGLVPAEYSAIRAEEPGSSESTTVGV